MVRLMYPGRGERNNRPNLVGALADQPVTEAGDTARKLEIYFSRKAMCVDELDLCSNPYHDPMQEDSPGIAFFRKPERRGQAPS